MIDQMGRWFPDYPGQQPYQDPAYLRAIGQPVHPGQSSAGQPQPQQQSMTPPTIRAEIVQIDALDAMDHYPMGAGTSQMFMTKDDEYISVRSMYANGQHSDVIYKRMPPEPPAPKIDPSDYVRKDELEGMLTHFLTAKPKAKEEE